MAKAKEDLGSASQEEGPRMVRRRLSVLEVCSFLLFCALCAAATIAFTTFYRLFIPLIVVDGAATFFQVDSLVHFDRSLLFFGLIVLSAGVSSSDLLLLTLETLALFAILDTSLFIRRLADTRVDLSVVKGRLRSYAYTVLPAFLLTYTLISVFSVLAERTIPVQSADAILGGSSVGIFVTIWIVARYLSSLRSAEGIPGGS